MSNPPPSSSKKDTTPNEREPDELDALLERTADASLQENHPPGNSSRGDGDGSNRPTTYQTMSSNVSTASASTRGHRKAHTVGIASGADNIFAKTTAAGRRMGGLFFGRNKTNKNKMHRKNKSSISDLFHSISENIDLEPITEDFQRRASSVKTHWKEELEDLDRGTGNGFFDMTATRSLGIIPEDLLDFGDEALALPSSMKFPSMRGEEVEEEEERPTVEEEKIPSTSPMILNLIMFLLAVFAHSSNSTALHMLTGVTPTMKLFWRMSASYLVLIPFALSSLRKDGLPQLTFSGWTTFLSASVFFTLQTLLFYTALEYTTIGNAVIYGNSQALLLIVAKVFVGERIHVLEGIGVVIAFSGAILCSQDSERSSQEEELNNALFGDLLALCSAAFGVAYLTVAKAVRSEMSVMFFITCVLFFGSIIVLVVLAVNPHEELTFDMDPFHGVFGGFDFEYHRFEVLAYLAIVVNFGGSMGFIRAMQHFDTIVIAVGTLCEPLAASLIAFLCHAGLLPGPLGWLGNFLVVVGTLCVVYPSMGKSDGGMH